MQTKNRRIPISKSLPAGWPSRLLLWALAMLVLAFGPATQAQQSTATIVGNVVDTTRAAVVGATIKITNTATGTIRSTVTDGVGQYTIPSLPVGTYMLSIDMQGFQSQRVGPITLDASQTARQNFELRAGKVTEVVEVEASNQAALLQTENASLGDVVDSHKIEDLPLNGRDFVQLAQLIPGANSGTPNSISARRGRGSMATSDAAYGSTSLEVDGARDTQNRYSIDGIEAMDYDGFTFNFSPSIDAIAEFRVDTSTSGTETTGAAGANVNLIVKSGANKFHGTLWEFNRNSALAQSRDALANVDVSPARLNQNQFGGNVGGPVYIPHLYNGHKKTFFFFNMERGTQLNGALPSSTTVPDAAERSGNIDELITAANAANPSKPLINPYTGNPFVLGQKITVDPKSAAMLQPSITPLPNMTPTGSSTNNYLFPTPKTLNHQTDIIARIDHSIGTKDTINGHFIYDDTYSNGTPSWINSNDNNDASTKHLAISEVHVFSPILVNEIRYGNNDFHEVEKFGTTGNSAYNIANGMMQIPLSSSDPRYYGPPNIGINSVGTGYALFNLQRQIGPRNRANKINQLVDSVSYQRGKHFLKFGADVARRADDFNLARDPRGTFTFDGRFTAPYSTGVPGAALLDFLLGYIGTDSITPTNTNDPIHTYIQGYSAQDTWNVSPKLTLNLGFRWDHFAPWVQNDNKFADIYVNGLTPTILVSAANSNGNGSTTPANSAYGNGLIQPVYHDFSPRVGFAYQPLGDGKLVVRGGYGIYYTPEIANVFYQMAEGAQEANAASPSANIGDGVPGQTLPNLTWSNPFPGTVQSNNPNYVAVQALDQHLKDEMSQEFNLTVQREFPGKVSAQLGYVGSHGSHTFSYYPDINAPVPVDPSTPGLGSINSRRPNQSFQRNVQGDISNGTSTYNSLQAKMERRVGKGLNILVSYTWAKSISGPGDVGGLVGGGLGNYAQAQNPFNPRADRSLSIYDQPHRLIGNALYDIPFFHNTSGVKKLLLDGFQVSTIASGVSGNMIGAVYNGPTVNASSTSITTRPDMVLGQKISLGGSKTPMKMFNTAAFQTPAVATFGNSRRLAIRAPGLVNDDFSVVKGFKFGETRNLQVRADFFNLFKHFNPIAGNIDTNMKDAYFGRLGNGVSQQYATRIIQIASKLYF